MIQQRSSKQLFVAAAKNGQAIACNESAADFLLKYPRGAYTSARTVNQRRIFLYETHLDRLVTSTLALQKSIISYHEMMNKIKTQTEATMGAAMINFKEKFGPRNAKEEYKITVLVSAHIQSVESTSLSTSVPTEEQNNSDIYCHIGILKEPPTGIVKLQVAGTIRSNAYVKDSEWVRQRQSLYDAMPEDVEEIILEDAETGALLEGSQTNFFVIQKGVLKTAEGGNLHGTVRAAVLEACATHNIPVDLTPPTLAEILEWDACFISSTSRLVLGCGIIEYNDESGRPMTKEFAQNSQLLDQIKLWVGEIVEQKSTLVLPQ